MKKIDWTRVNEKPRNVSEAMAALCAVVADFGPWHPDDDPHELVSRSGRRILTRKDADRLETLLGRIMKHLPGEFIYRAMNAAEGRFFCPVCIRTHDPDEECARPSRRELKTRCLIPRQTRRRDA